MKKIFVVPVYRAVVQAGTVRVLASSEKEALKAARKGDVEPLVKDWTLVDNENPISFPETPREAQDNSGLVNVVGD